MSEIQIVIKTEQDLQQIEKKVESLGTELNASQDNFKIAVKATIQQACNVGRIAKDARAYIKALPTHHQYAKILGKNTNTILWKKPTFSYWVKEYTDLDRSTIYDMIELYEKLKDEPDFEPPKGMTWRECLAILTGKEKPLIQIEDEAEEQVIDIVGKDVQEANTDIESRKAELATESKKIVQLKLEAQEIRLRAEQLEREAEAKADRLYNEALDKAVEDANKVLENIKADEERIKLRAKQILQDANDKASKLPKQQADKIIAEAKLKAENIKKEVELKLIEASELKEKLEKDINERIENNNKPEKLSKRMVQQAIREQTLRFNHLLNNESVIPDHQKFVKDILSIFAAFLVNDSMAFIDTSIYNNIKFSVDTFLERHSINYTEFIEWLDSQ